MQRALVVLVVLCGVGCAGIAGRFAPENYPELRAQCSIVALTGGDLDTIGRLSFTSGDYASATVRPVCLYLSDSQFVQHVDTYFEERATEGHHPYPAGASAS